MQGYTIGEEPKPETPGDQYAGIQPINEQRNNEPKKKCALTKDAGDDGKERLSEIPNADLSPAGPCSGN